MIKGCTARRKGHGYERQVAKRLREMYPEVKRGDQSMGGSTAPDVDCQDWWIECKAYKKMPNPMRWFYRVLEETDGRPVALFMKEDRMPQAVMLDAETFYALIKESHRGLVPRLSVGCPDTFARAKVGPCLANYLTEDMIDE